MKFGLTKEELREWLGLSIASVVGSLLILPYALSVQENVAELDFLRIAIQSALVSLLVFGGMAYLGLRLRRNLPLAAFSEHSGFLKASAAVGLFIGLE